jgi:hypothetical protein
VRILFSRVDLCQWILGPASQGTVLDRFPTAACIKFLRPRAQGFSRACTVTRSWVDFGSLLIVSAALHSQGKGARLPVLQSMELPLGLRSGPSSAVPFSIRQLSRCACF